MRRENVRGNLGPFTAQVCAHAYTSTRTHTHARTKIQVRTRHIYEFILLTSCSLTHRGSTARTADGGCRTKMPSNAQGAEQRQQRESERCSEATATTQQRREASLRCFSTLGKKENILSHYETKTLRLERFLFAAEHLALPRGVRRGALCLTAPKAGAEEEEAGHKDFDADERLCP